MRGCDQRRYATPSRFFREIADDFFKKTLDSLSSDAQRSGPAAQLAASSSDDVSRSGALNGQVSVPLLLPRGALTEAVQ